MREGESSPSLPKNQGSFRLGPPSLNSFAPSQWDRVWATPRASSRLKGFFLIGFVDSFFLQHLFFFHRKGRLSFEL